MTERPAIYILDALGIIRHKNVEEEDVKPIIDRLLKKLATTSTKR